MHRCRRVSRLTLYPINPSSVEESPVGHHYLETINPFLWILFWRQFPSDDHAPCFAHVLIMLHKGFLLYLAGGISTPLNNMSSSVGILEIPNWMEKQHISQWIDKTTNQSYLKPAINKYSNWMDIPTEWNSKPPTSHISETTIYPATTADPLSIWPPCHV